VFLEIGSSRFSSPASEEAWQAVDYESHVDYKPENFLRNAAILALASPAVAASSAAIE
jgi:hypothetical protein